MDSEYISGLMAKNTKDTGKMENRMEMVDLQTLKEKVGLESGKMGKMLNGTILKKARK